MKTTGLLWVSMLSLLVSCAHKKTDSMQYPEHWWAKLDNAKEIPSWEILPEEGEKGKSVILSKRHELGILSNFAPTVIELDGKQFGSVEGLWQSSKYPDPKIKNDPRKKCREFKLSREHVEKLSSFVAKAAGDPGSNCMKKLKIDWVSFDGIKMPYREKGQGTFYQLILRAMRAKLDQNTTVKSILIQTAGLELLPDHHTSPDDPPAWKYFLIWQELRDALIAQTP